MSGNVDIFAVETTSPEQVIYLFSCDDEFFRLVYNLKGEFDLQDDAGVVIPASKKRRDLIIKASNAVLNGYIGNEDDN